LGLCEAAFRMNVASLRLLLLEFGLPADLLADHSRSAWHCLAGVFTFGDAHGRSQVFAELKGKSSFLEERFDPPLPHQQSSVVSKDVLHSLEKSVARTAVWLQRAGVPLDLQDVSGYTALHIAVLGGLRSLSIFLLEAGANPCIKNSDGRTPLHFAAALGHAEICGDLVRFGASLDDKDKRDVSARDILSQPGPVSAADAQRYVGIVQRPVKQIKRFRHPEELPVSSGSRELQFSGWHGDGGWNTTRLPDFEDDMSCAGIDQFFADEVDGKLLFNYLARNAPVLVRGLLHRWPVEEFYSKASMRAKHGNLSVLVSDIPYAAKFGGQPGQAMTINQVCLCFRG
jgi:hypothetical protein